MSAFYDRSASNLTQISPDIRRAIRHRRGAFADGAALRDRQLSEWQILSPDMIAPVIATPSNILVGTESGGGTTVTFNATATDDTLNDISPPVITVPANITVPATHVAGTTVTFAISAQDVMDGARPTTDTPASGSVFPVGTTVVTTMASDTKGNTGSRTFNVTVLPFIQTRARLKFDETSGTTQLVTLPAGVVNGLTTCTISAWVNLNAASNRQRIFDFGTGTNNYMFLSPRNGANSRIRFSIRTASGAEQIIDGAATLPTGGWQHVAVVLNGATGNNYLGRSQFNDPYLAGTVDDFQIIAQALTAPQVAALAAPPVAPVSVTAGPGDTQALLSWSAVAGATSYNVKLAPTGGGPYAFIANTPPRASPTPA